MNWRAFLQAVAIANEARIHFPAIRFILEILRQFDGSLANADSNNRPEQSGNAGFVYVIKDKSNGERFKSGYRARPPWRDSQLRSHMGESQDFVLIIPAKDASALEKKLRKAYARGTRRGQWFTLNQRRSREISVIAALVIAVTGDSLGMAPVGEEILELGKQLFKHAKALAKTMFVNVQSKQTQADEVDDPVEPESEFDDFSTIPELDWEWESVLDKNYRDLPKAKGKSGYICIIRDNDARRSKIFFDDHPVDSIEAAFLETSLRFPLEIVLILKVDKIKKAVESLLSPSERKNGTEWVELTQEELGEFKQSAKGAFVHGSLYVGPKTHFGLETLPTEGFREYPRLEGDAGYICVVQGVQGVQCGERRKIWSSRQPKRWTRYSWRARKLNSPRELRASSMPIRFKCVVRAAHAQSFKSFLHKRYRQQRRKGRWFELGEEQLEEIRKMGR